MKQEKILFPVLASVLSVVAMTGCSGNKKTTSLTVCIASEPQSIDPALNSAVDGATMLANMNGNIYRYVQKDGKVVLEYDLAKTITKTAASVVDKTIDGTGAVVDVTYPGGTRYTVTLKDNIFWSNGDPITADDFIYSWNRASGSTLAGDYCYMFEYICNGAGHETDDAKVPELAMKKVNDKTFTFDVMTDVPFMDQLMAFPTYQPVHKKTVEQYDTTEAGTWATEAATFVSCGAYYIKEWVHDSKIVMAKNEKYWDAANVQMDEIVFALSDDSNAMYASFQTGEYQMIDDVAPETLATLQAQQDENLVVADQMGTYYISFNMNSTKFKKADTEEKRVKVRKALGLLLDRHYIVNNITMAGEIPANGFVSKGLTEPDKTQFVAHNGPQHDGAGYYKTGATAAEQAENVAEAIKLLKEVGYTYDEGTKKFTDFETGLSYIYNASAAHKAIAQYVRDEFAKYGITIALSEQEWASFLTQRKEGNYDIARNGWVADYDDPSSYLSMWTTVSGNNDSQFGRGAHKDYNGYQADVNRNGQIDEEEKNLTWAQSYDVLMEMSNKEADQTKRFALLHEVEDILMQTGAICPIYYYSDPLLIKPNIKGFYSTPLGYKYFLHCTIEK